MSQASSSYIVRSLQFIVTICSQAGHSAQVRVLRWVPVVSLTTLLKFLLAVHVCATSSPAPNWSACDSAPAVRVLQLVCLQMVVPGILLVRHEKRYRLRFLKEKQYTPEDVRPAKARAGPSQL